MHSENIVSDTCMQGTILGLWGYDRKQNSPAHMELNILLREKDIKQIKMSEVVINALERNKAE